MMQAFDLSTIDEHVRFQIHPEPCHEFVDCVFVGLDFGVLLHL
jgi:hypothetical protein